MLAGPCVWGLAHGALVALYHQFSKQWDSLPRIIRVIATFGLVSLLWLLFLFDFAEVKQFAVAASSNGLQPQQVSKGPGEAVRSVGLGRLCFASILFLDRSGTFIYFRF